MGKPTIALSPDRTMLFLSIPIEEGEQYTVGKLDFSGELLGMRPFLPQLLQSTEGELFVRSKVGHDLFAVADFYKDMGYAYVNVNPVTKLDPKARTLGLTFDVQPGRKVFFERIEIQGNAKTRDKVIRRELRIYEGDLYSASAIKISKQRITALGFFETVEISTKKGSSDDRIVAVVEVKEKATGTFQVGAGFSSYENFILTAQISQNNFFGWGQTLSLQVQWSSLRQLGQIQFVEPYFLDTKWTFAFDLYANENLYSTFTRGAIGGSVTWGYELAGLSWFLPGLSKLEDLRVFLTYTLERVRVTAAVQDLLLYNRYRSGVTSAARLAVAWDRRDNRLFPTRGFYLSASARPGPALPGAELPLRRPGEPLLPGDARVPLLPGDLAGADRPLPDPGRRDPRLEREQPGPGVGALLRGRREHRPRLPALLHHRRWRRWARAPTPTPRCACSRWAATSSWS